MDEKKFFTYEEALAASREYFNGDELAADVFVNKYALRDNSSNILESNPDQMHRRAAKELARIEAKYVNPLSEDEIYNRLKHFKEIVLQGSPMSAIGNQYQLQSLSNCFVIPSPYDSYAGILKTDQEMVQIAKRRGGIGFDISNIRPKGLVTHNAAKTTDGIAVFMERYSNTCREVAQSGRRGALLLSISCHHPEIMTFINIKRDLKKVTGANISIRFTDEFMRAVQNNEQVELRFPVEQDAKHIVKTMTNAREIWDAFIDSAWSSAEPGALYWSTALRKTPSDIYTAEGFGSKSTNPCGEIILSEYDSCRLTVINTLAFVKNPYTSRAKFDFEKFAEAVEIGQRLMDDIIDLELEAVDKIIQKIDSDPEPDDIKIFELGLWHKIKAAAMQGRRTGLGITALGDTLAAMGITYGAKNSISMTESIYKQLAVSAYRSSVNLAKERGAFPIWSKEKEKGHEFLEQILKSDHTLARDHAKYGRRNIALTTTAPTGSVSIMTQTTSGIEPVFLTHYKRRRKINPEDKVSKVDFVDQTGDSWQEYTVYHHGVKRWMEVTGETDISKSPYAGATANDIDWEASVDLQAAAQKWICHAISKTCNIPNNAPKELVDKIYMRAWEKGCKGFTVYRDGCRSGVLVAESAPKKDNQGRPTQITPVHAPKRPHILDCEIHQATVKGSKWTVFVGMLEDKPYELFAGASDKLSLPAKCKVGKIAKIKQGQYDLHVDIGDDEPLIIKDVVNVFNNPESAWATRMISMSLRHGVEVDFVVEQLNKDGGIADANKVLARILKKYIPDGTKVKSSAKCLSCGSSNLVYAEGCLTCLDCGSSKCG